MTALADGTGCGGFHFNNMTPVIAVAAAAWGDVDIWEGIVGIVRSETGTDDVWDVKLLVKALQGRLHQEVILSTFVVPATSSMAAD